MEKGKNGKKENGKGKIKKTEKKIEKRKKMEKEKRKWKRKTKEMEKEEENGKGKKKKKKWKKEKREKGRKKEKWKRKTKNTGKKGKIWIETHELKKGKGKAGGETLPALHPQRLEAATRFTSHQHRDRHGATGSFCCGKKAPNGPKSPFFLPAFALKTSSFLITASSVLREAISLREGTCGMVAPGSHPHPWEQGCSQSWHRHPSGKSPIPHPRTQRPRCQELKWRNPGAQARAHHPQGLWKGSNGCIASFSVFYGAAAID